MSDWEPVFVAVTLFVLLTPGCVFRFQGITEWLSLEHFKQVSTKLSSVRKRD
ncbi:unnamed protein product [Brassica rapa subsp. trilocularis]